MVLGLKIKIGIESNQFQNGASFTCISIAAIL